MGKQKVIMLVILAFVMMIAGCSKEGKQSDASASGDVKKFTIQATKYKFDVTEIRVKQGDTIEVTLKNRDGFHTLSFEGYNKEVKGNRTISFVASEKGEFIYKCGVVCGSGHKKMVGKLIVE